MVLGPGLPVGGSGIAVEAAASTSQRPFDRSGVASAARLDDRIHFLSRAIGIAALASAVTVGINFLF